MRRTNSLAFAKSDCHDCSKLSRKCDRQRPRCTTCQNYGTTCRGYSMSLKWNTGYSIDNKPPKIVSKKGIDSTINVGSPECTLSKPRNRNFVFVSGKGKKRSRKDEISSNRRQKKNPSLVDNVLQQNGIESILAEFPSLETTSPSEAFSFSPSPGLFQTSDEECYDYAEDINQYQIGTNASIIYRRASEPARIGFIQDEMIDYSDISFQSQDISERSLSMDLGPQIRFSSLFDKLSGLLEIYDKKFCSYPITSDFSVNPFRCRSDTSVGSQHLLHAIVGVSCHFLSQDPDGNLQGNAIDHKNTATILYQDALKNGDLASKGIALLDTALMLWQLEGVVSALNSWRLYLSNAYNLINLTGFKWSARTWTQVSMLLWWDSIVALLSRKPCVLPYSYFQAALKLEGPAWTFFELNGCPRELLVPMMQLASLTTENQPKLIDEIEISIRNYKYQSVEHTDEELLHLDRDRALCCEAFQNCLLIYIWRVFRKKDKISYLARVTLDLVRSCRPNMIQKQVLFPVFIAGAETDDYDLRNIAREYCQNWYNKLGIQMYATVLSVLEELWESKDMGRQIWWGDILDDRRRNFGEHLDFCFG